MCRCWGLRNWMKKNFWGTSVQWILSKNVDSASRTMCAKTNQNPADLFPGFLTNIIALIHCIQTHVSRQTCDARNTISSAIYGQISNENWMTLLENQSDICETKRGMKNIVRLNFGQKNYQMTPNEMSVFIHFGYDNLKLPNVGGRKVEYRCFFNIPNLKCSWFLFFAEAVIFPSEVVADNYYGSSCDVVRTPKRNIKNATQEPLVWLWSGDKSLPYKLRITMVGGSWERHLGKTGQFQ